MNSLKKFSEKKIDPNEEERKELTKNKNKKLIPFFDSFLLNN